MKAAADGAPPYWCWAESLVALAQLLLATLNAAALLHAPGVVAAFEAARAKGDDRELPDGHAVEVRTTVQLIAHATALETAVDR